ncbi:hypothetical protein J132_01072 [Termitomyces sp. J132]|nr:hypothetical protein J132_01072 [Termitomyces sp. J132]
MSIKKFHNEIHGCNTPASSWNRERMELTHGCLAIRLGVETEITGASVGAYILGDLRPPVILGYQLQCLPPSKMFGYPRIVVLLYNVLAKF